MGLRSTLKKQAMGLGQKAMERLFADEKRAQRVAEAIGSVQRGKQALDSTQRVVMHQLNFATKADFKDLGKQLSALRRRVKALDDKLSAR
jgi:polyhydroxyalkanoate synthesis regulator phasin